MEPDLREVETYESKVEREQGKVETAERKVTPAFDIRNFIQKVEPE